MEIGTRFRNRNMDRYSEELRIGYCIEYLRVGNSGEERSLPGFRNNNLCRTALHFVRALPS